MEFSGPVGYASNGDQIYRSADEGRTWSSLDALDLRDAVDLAVPAPATAAVAFDDCRMRRTDDAGRRFVRQRVVPEGTRCPADIHALSYSSPFSGVVVLRDGSTYTTSDGGQDWVPAAGFPSRALSTDIEWLSPTRGVATLASAGIALTEDAGRTWRPVQNAPAGSALTAVDFPTADVGYAVARSNEILRSSDGGATWTQVAGAPSGGLEGPLGYSEIACADTSRCVLSLNTTSATGFGIVQTSDGGATVKAPEARLPVLRVTRATSSTRYVALSDGGGLFTSSDGGASFTSETPMLTFTPNGVRALSTRSALAFGTGGGLARSDDGGRSWRQQQLAGVVQLLDADAPSAAVTYVVELSRDPKEGGVLRTEDGGVTVQEGTPVPGEARAVIALSTKRVVIGSTRGVFLSEDGARSVRRVARGAGIRQLDRAGTAVLAVGTRRLLLSRDRGRSWNAIRRPLPTTIIDADFVTAKRGFAVVRGRTRGTNRMFGTRDGGRTWAEVLGLGANVPLEVSFGDARHGYVEDGGVNDGRVLATSDGGRSWRPQLVARDGLTFWGLAAVPGRGAFLATRSGLFGTATSGDGPARSRITVRADKRVIRRGTRVLISGRLRGRAGADVAVKVRSGGRWQRTLVPVDAQGRFVARVRLRRSAAVVAQYQGKQSIAAAGSPPLRIRVRR